MKMVSKKFSGQLSGDKAKESYFGNLRDENNVKLPKVGAVQEVALKPEALTGAFLSILDGRNSLSVDGKPVSKIKVYAGEEKIPAMFALTFKIERVSEASCKLRANIQSK